MHARAPALSNWPEKHRKPAAPLADVQLVSFTSDATFRRARQEWLREILRQGDTQQFAACYALSTYMGFAKGGVAYADQHRLAVDLNCSVRSVGRWLDRAVTNGHLVEQRRGANTNLYRMSFSPSQRATIELEHENRMAEFTVESARRRLHRDAARPDRFVGTDQTDLSELSGQVCPINSDRFDRQSYPSSSEDDPDWQSSERLGEGEPDSREPAELEKKNERDDLLAALGRGDLEWGRAIAAELGERQLAYLAGRVERDGMTGAAAAISNASAQAARQISERAA